MGVNGLFCSAGLKWSPITFQILPLLALGLGINDFFVIAQHCALAVERAQKAGGTATKVEVMADAMAHGGASVTLSSVANAAAFGIGAISPIGAVYTFSIHAMITVIVNYILALTIYPAILSACVDGFMQAAASTKNK